ncbi:flagellar basal-body MS-ring/collar protein FliF [Alteribacillus iranensis]|uniref:Flagellar M-ring protein n=1 Tax=Alteribacillus iranensis TaxID=930128 RepID=A0A1I2A4N4_9BACI|nr:flagellar basal-body MS-ring/collar protein FliF [Alteribacillus iranensis]SFE39074.1 flagellar M-ring protein FliF [Alteribacillus iranensis]
MKEKLIQEKDKITAYWNQRTKKQKSLLLALLILLIVVLFLSAFFGFRTSYTPLYTDLPPEETGQIKESLDARGVSSQLSNDGTTISVPSSEVDALKVELAAEGIPKSGSIDYSFIEGQMGFGMTDNEFNVMERAAMQTELEKLIENIEGVDKANVMITLPEESTWVSEEQDSATASVVLDTGGRSNVEQSQVQALYHLVSKSVPNLSEDNIVIMNERFEYFDQEKQNNSGSTMNAYQEQRNIQEDIEKDIQSQIQQMLGTMMGPDKVVVAVTTDLDFTQENREEQLVEPVDEENMEGIEISAERITESYEGGAPQDGGVPGAGEEDIANYPGAAAGSEGDYERTENRINNEVNRIHKEIVESPYKIRDMGIQVMVEPPNPEDPNSLNPQTIGDIEQILSTVVSTSIDETYMDEVTDAEVLDKIFVSAQQFNGKVDMESEPTSSIPLWMYIAAGVLAASVLLLLFLLLRKRKTDKEEDLFLGETETEQEVPELPEEEQTEHAIRRKQLENLAKDNPEEFSKLLRTWLSED